MEVIEILMKNVKLKENKKKLLEKMMVIYDMDNKNN